MRQRPRVFVTRSLAGPALARLAEHGDVDVWPEPTALPPAVLASRVAPAEGLLCLLSDRVDAALLARAPHLRAISSLSVGVDHIDLAAATARGVPVGHTPGVLTETTADLAFALLLAAARRVPEADRCVRDGHWRPERVWEPDLLLGRDVSGATLGILGLGAIGRAVARRARGFGMRVLAWSRTPRPLEDLAGGVELVALPELLAQADFVSVHVALAPETRGLLDAETLGAMKPGAILVNTARGGIVDEAALAEALRTGRLAAAGLDVFAHEPLERTSPLLALPNVVLSPHIGSASRATRTRMAELAVDNLLAALAGRRMVACANPEVYDAHERPETGHSRPVSR
ncbi:D-glycerate dehydrogenase [Myxococcota bacterium]|nr:D-glycerate dehydrogenase [Myxococcota bacterium]